MTLPAVPWMHILETLLLVLTMCMLLMKQREPVIDETVISADYHDRKRVRATHTGSGFRFMYSSEP